MWRKELCRRDIVAGRRDPQQGLRFSGLNWDASSVAVTATDMHRYKQKSRGRKSESEHA